MSDDEFDEFAARPAVLDARSDSGTGAVPASAAKDSGALTAMLQRDRDWESARQQENGGTNPLTLTPEEVVAVVGPRPAQRRFGPLGIVISALAVALVAVLIFVFVARANAETPAQSAMRSYTEQTSQLASAHKSLLTSYDEYVAAYTDALSLNAAAAQAFSAVAGASDEAARAAAETHRVDFEASLAQSSVADPNKAALAVPVVENPEQLASVAEALNELKAERDRVKAARADIRAAKAELQSSRMAFAEQARTFGKTVAGTAAIINGQNPDAAQQWRDAVAAAAAAVTKDVSAGNLTATSSFQSYAASVAALRTENARVLAERALVESERGNSTDGGSDSDSSTGENSDPSSPTPVEPPAVEPPVTEPPVTEPPVTEPPAVGPSSPQRPTL